jgi:sensor histidine kinase YesM
LHTDIETITGANITITPMVLIVFIENAFKHAKNTLNEKIYIGIGLKIVGSDILFTVKNSYSDAKQEASTIHTSSGLGVSNTIRRLNLLYEGDYELNQFVKDYLYIVTLRLKIK